MPESKIALPIVLAAGGTGGHVFPAVALAEEVIARDYAVVFITDRRGKTYVPDALLSQPKFMLKVLPLDRKAGGVLGLLKLGCQIALSCLVSLRCLWKPVHCVVGFSGFPTLAPLIAGIILRKPIMVHEQNTVLGRVNSLLHSWLRKILISTRALQHTPKLELRKLAYVGLPIRKDIAQLRDMSYQMPDQNRGEEIRILIIGGSQGAQSFAQVIPEMIAKLPVEIQKRLVVLHQVRLADQATAQKLYQTTQVKQLTMVPFIYSMAEALATTHLVLSRSGASSIAEIAAAGRPAILIPYPYATDDHQTMNAFELTRLGGGWLIPHHHFNAVRLKQVFLALVEDPKKLLFAAQRVRLGFEKNSINNLASEVLSV
jgi:UDP-N-acetylglucosamine:LPS N-acetylglucosamine transferase